MKERLGEMLSLGIYTYSSAAPCTVDFDFAPSETHEADELLFAFGNITRGINSCAPSLS
jgi:hypothetical protein